MFPTADLGFGGVHSQEVRVKQGCSPLAAPLWALVTCSSSCTCPSGAAHLDASYPVLGAIGPFWGTAMSTHESSCRKPRVRRLQFFFLGGGMVALQCCVGFCWTMKRISYVYTYIPSLLDFPPTCTPTPPL